MHIHARTCRLFHACFSCELTTVHALIVDHLLPCLWFLGIFYKEDIFALFLWNITQIHAHFLTLFPPHFSENSNSCWNYLFFPSIFHCPFHSPKEAYRSLCSSVQDMKRDFCIVLICIKCGFVPLLSLIKISNPVIILSQISNLCRRWQCQEKVKNQVGNGFLWEINCKAASENWICKWGG